MRDEIIICRCGQWNRLQGQDRKRGHFRCGQCGNELVSKHSSSGSRKRWALLLVVPVIAAVVYAFKPVPPASGPPVQPARVSQQSAAPPQPTPRRLSASPEPKALAQPPKPPAPVAQVSKPQATAAPQEAALVPAQIKTGIIRRKGKGNQVALLKIEADASNYAMKLIDKKSNAEVLMVLIKANQTFETKVALGTYKIVAASGDVWYGEKHLFGPSTSYFVLRKASGVSLAGDDEFQFTLKDNTYSGHHIRLQKALGGTLSTESIPPGEFQQQ